MKLSHLNGLRALEATLRNGTFSKAAEELGVSVAAIGQHVRTLEAYLDVRLFDRLPSGVQPTNEARAITARLTNGFTQIESALSELRGSDKAGRLSVTLSHFMLDEWLSTCLHRFQERAPGLALSFHTSQGLADLFSGDFDMAIRFSPEPGPEYECCDLHRGYFCPNLHAGLRPTPRPVTRDEGSDRRSAVPPSGHDDGSCVDRLGRNSQVARNSPR